MQRAARRGGFTLVELMMVIAVLGVLAAVAIPMVAGAQIKARKAEALPNVQGIVTTTWSYMLSTDESVPPPHVFHPRVPAGLDKSAVPWSGSKPPAEWDGVGWEPDGDVRCSYLVAGSWAETTSPSYSSGEAACDVDDDQRGFRVEKTVFAPDSGYADTVTIGCTAMGGYTGSEANCFEAGPSSETCQCG